MLIQLENYLATPEARVAFGPGVSEAMKATKDLESQVEETVRWAAPGSDVSKMRANVARWAAAHPTDGDLATRESIRADLASRILGDDLPVLAIAGEASADIQAIIARLDYLPFALPKQAAWEAELAYLDFAEPRVTQVLDRADKAMRRLDQAIEWLGPGLDQLADRQREAMMDAVTQQRVAFGALIAAERQGLMHAVSEERRLVLDAVREKQKAATEDVRRRTLEKTDEASRKANVFADRVLVIAAGLVAAAILLWGAVTLWVQRAAEREPRASKEG
jgi:hypothetical protein